MLEKDILALPSNKLFSQMPLQIFLFLAGKDHVTFYVLSTCFIFVAMGGVI